MFNAATESYSASVYCSVPIRNTRHYDPSYEQPRETCLADVMLKVLGHQGRSPGRADSKQHKTERSERRFHLEKNIGGKNAFPRV